MIVFVAVVIPIWFTEINLQGERQKVVVVHQNQHYGHLRLRLIDGQTGRKKTMHKYKEYLRFVVAVFFNCRMFFYSYSFYFNFILSLNGGKMYELKQALKDVKATRRCREIAYAIARTNYVAAVEYALVYTRRQLIEKSLN